MAAGRKQCGQPACRRAHLAKRQREFYAAYRGDAGASYFARYAESRRSAAKLRKVKLRAVTMEAFDYREVFDRDDWLCGICDEPVDPELTCPHPLSVSLDHVVPLSRGGEHTRANTRCAHLICNARRGDRCTPEEEQWSA